MQIISQLKEKLIEILKEAEWYSLLRGFFMEDSMDKILLSLWQKKESGHRFIPQSSLWFKPFQSCPLDKLKVVLLNDAPWYDKDALDGLALSSKKNLVPLRPIYNAFLEKPVFESIAGQGVLLLNIAITRPPFVGKETDHLLLWQPLIAYLLDMLMDRQLVYVLIGEKTHSYADLLSDKEVLLYDDPIPFSGNPDEWNGRNFPKEVNEKLEKIGLDKINW